MRSPPATLDEARLRELLGRSRFVRRVEVVESTGSTNDDVRRLARQGCPSGTVVIANRQRAGRGRLGRGWHSAPGLGLYLSVLVRPAGTVQAPTRWSLTAALAACEACEAVGCDDVVIEWPNDLYHGERKLAGILTELRSVGGKVQEMIVGTGFNVNHRASDFPPELASTATSLALARAGKRVDREGLAAQFLARLGERVALLERGGWEEIARCWTSRAPRAVGAPVVVRMPRAEHPFDAVTRGVDSAGALRVERADGTVVSLHSSASVER